ncbi:OadG-related small transporter subunit [Ignavigranum ruoffiae]
MITFDNQSLMQALELMLFGMGGVFLVLTILFLVSKLLLKIFPAD